MVRLIMVSHFIILSHLHYLTHMSQCQNSSNFERSKNKYELNKIILFFHESNKLFRKIL